MMTAHEERDHSVANPDRTVLDENDKTEKRIHDQDWPEVAEEVKQAVEQAETKP